MSDLHWIAGPPGAGKTTTLVKHVTRAVEKRGRHSVCIASMTRTASNHIADRAADALGEQALPPDACGTLHAHAYRTLDRPDLAETWDGLSDWNREHPAQRLTPGSNDDQVDDDHRPGAQAVHARVMAHRNRCTPHEQWTSDEQAHHEQWTDYKAQTGRLDFADLIEHATGTVHHLIPSVWLIDEAQDLSRLELKLAKSWIDRADIGVCVGDLDQALYSFRGADASALAALPWTTRRALTQSYRVPRAVHQSAQAWIRRVSRRDDIEAAPTPEPGRVDRSPLSLKTPDLVAGLAADSDEPTMVLTHTRRMVAGILRALDDARVPYHNPYRPQMDAWNPLGAAAAPLRAYLAAHRPGGRDWTWADIAAWTEPLDARAALARGARRTIEQACKPDRFGESRAEQVVTLDELAALLGWDPAGGLHPALVGDTAWWERHLKRPALTRLRRATRLVEHHGQDVLWETPRIIAGTIHSAKGGEADRVIIAPDISRAAHQGWAAGSRAPARDPLLRLGYVALTRAARSATILAPAGPEYLPLGGAA